MQANPDFAIFDHIDSPIFVLESDAEGVPRYVAYNAFACQGTGLPMSHFLGRTALEAFSGAFGRTAFQRHCEVARTGQPMTYELELPFQDSVQTVRTTLKPVPHGTDGGVRLYGSSTNISEERAAREAQVSFNTLTTEMEQFVSMAAHDLRAPMRNVALLADMLRDNFIDYGDGKLELINLMEDVALKSSALISDVLAHARATAPVAAQTQFSFPALCCEICDVLDPHQSHQITYEPVELQGDRTALQIAVRNLIDNALKHGKREVLCINIGVTSGLPGHIEVTLTDNGGGFDNPALTFLNGGDFKVDSGYGLLGVRRMLLARGGAISASNTADGMGAMIRFSMPGRVTGPSRSLGESTRKVVNPVFKLHSAAQLRG